jgi:hypothetical protein
MNDTPIVDQRHLGGDATRRVATRGWFSAVRRNAPTGTTPSAKEVEPLTENYMKVVEEGSCRIFHASKPLRYAVTAAGEGRFLHGVPSPRADRDASIGATLEERGRYFTQSWSRSTPHCGLYW